MVQRKKRRIGKKTSRSMYTWCHYRFKQRLLSKARQYPDCIVVIGDESYTCTVTCGKCGHLNPSFSAKMFHCNKCHFRVNREKH
jgi:putative transposase